MPRSHEGEDNEAAESSTVPDRIGAEGNSNDAQNDGNDATEHGGTRSAEEVKKKHKAGLAKKLQFMTHLMKSFDMLVYAELCALYYMDCSFFRLILRSIPHSLFLSPKSEDFLVLMPAHRPHVFAIFVPNILCMLLHAILSLPAAGEATHGYLQGGVVVDFIGQKPPSSRFTLLLLDVAILGLQCFMLAVHGERERLRKVVMPSRRMASSTAGTETADAMLTSSTQDHDAEERGVLRDAPEPVETADGIELQPLTGSAATETGQEPGAAMPEGYAASSLSDTLRSGNAILADFHVLNSIRTSGNDYQSAAAYSFQTIGYTATLARLAAERRARLETRQQP